MPGRKVTTVSEVEYLYDALRHIEAVVQQVRKPVAKAMTKAAAFVPKGRIFGRGCEVEAEFLSRPFGRACLAAGDLGGPGASGPRPGRVRRASAARTRAKR
jgi:hypothetical protein